MTPAAGRLTPVDRPTMRAPLNVFGAGGGPSVATVRTSRSAAGGSGTWSPPAPLGGVLPSGRTRSASVGAAIESRAVSVVGGVSVAFLPAVSAVRATETYGRAVSPSTNRTGP